MKTKNKAILVVSVMMLVYSFTLTGCGNDNVNSATDKNNQEQNGTNNNGSSVGDDLGNAVDNVGDAVGDVGNAVGDMLGANFNGFSSYEDAHDYFMSTMQGGNNSGRYEVRNENKDLGQYQNGRYGYQFELYDVTSGEGSRLGEYWVDRDTGKIYLKNDKSGEFEEYTNDSTSTQNGGTSTGANNR
ncbi:MAG: ubiquinone biosynthesis protein [Lachnospiraceae bacterium]|nr:ubiquinone biosynthesis protein [Lachnospiraceae bacterium]